MLFLLVLLLLFTLRFGWNRVGNSWGIADIEFVWVVVGGGGGGVWWGVD